MALDMDLTDDTEDADLAVTDLLLELLRRPGKHNGYYSYYTMIQDSGYIYLSQTNYTKLQFTVYK